MPSRNVRLLIFTFWLATASWYLNRELIPFWTAYDAPILSVDLADEAVRQSLPVNWTLTRTGHKPCLVRTSIEYHDDLDEFSLHCIIHNLSLIADVPVSSFKSSYRMTRQGRILQSKTEVSFKPPIPANVQITARAEGDETVVSCNVRSSLGNFAPAPQRVPMKATASINPLHPVHKLRNVRPGQQWIQTITDSLAEAQSIGMVAIAQELSGVRLQSFLPERKEAKMIAEVTGPKPLEWHGTAHECHVIEYRGDNRSARVWVRVLDGWVLRQEVVVAGDELILQRD